MVFWIIVQLYAKSNSRDVSLFQDRRTGRTDIVAQRGAIRIKRSLHSRNQDIDTEIRPNDGPNDWSTIEHEAHREVTLPTRITGNDDDKQILYIILKVLRTLVNYFFLSRFVMACILAIIAICPPPQLKVRKGYTKMRSFPTSWSYISYCLHSAKNMRVRNQSAINMKGCGPNGCSVSSSGTKRVQCQLSPPPPAP